MGEEIQALIQRHRVRKNPLNLPECHARRRNKVVHDPHAGFRDDGQIEVQQVVIVLVYRAVERVLDGNHRSLDLFLLESPEYVFEPLAGQYVNALSEQFASGLFAECATLSLEGY